MRFSQKPLVPTPPIKKKKEFDNENQHIFILIIKLSVCSMGLIKIGFKLNSKDAKAQKSLEKIFMSESIILQKTEDKKKKKLFQGQRGY